MRITSVETFKYWASWCNWLFVKVSTDEGIYGWGEGSLHGAIESVETAVHELSRVLIGQDPAGIERHWQEMYTAWRWRGGPTLMTALSAIDIALWDIEGKRLGVPVARLLGGPFRTRIKAYASHWLSGVSTAEEAKRGAAEAVRRGFKAFKWTAFDPNLMLENEYAAVKHYATIMSGARQGAGDDVEIYVECAERLSPRTAVLAAREFEPYRPGWFEEPVPFENPEVMARVQSEMAVPVATGERLIGKWEFEKLLRSGGCKVIQPDVMHSGGITEMRLRDSICTQPVRYENGFFELPNAPGLGTDLDLESLKGHSFKPQPISGNRQTLWR